MAVRSHDRPVRMISSTPGRWGDLKARVLSGAALLILGIAAIWQGGLAFTALAVLASGLMVWELAMMTRRPRDAAGGLPQAGTAVPGRFGVLAQNWSAILGLLAALVLALVFWLHSPFALVLLLLPSLAGLWRVRRRDLLIYPAYAFAIMLTGYGLVALRNGLVAPYGLAAIALIIAIVVASDVLGYFVGRMLGGPKFWPRISPKKTWSGTVAGWLGAAVVAAVFVALGYGRPALIGLAPVLAFAGQLGDIAESWIKRRVGVKDSSNLIPGHGGVLDRFDALIGAVLAVLACAQFGALPL